MPLSGEIARAFEAQAEACHSLGSPFTGHLCKRLVEVLDDSTALGRTVMGWERDPVASALALRLCGALHMAVRAGEAPTLARMYPPVGETGPALDDALRDAISGSGEALIARLESAPQTNEVARSGILLGGLLHVAAWTGLPMDLREIGASAGLNLYPDRYAYELGAGRRWGPADAPLTITCEWRGAMPPLDASLRIADRAGVDLAPIDARDAAARERVLGYIWPDQLLRLARISAALDHAAEHPLTLTRADAAGWVENWLAKVPRRGIARVLMHSIAWQYFPETTQRRIGAAMAAAGGKARSEWPLAWLRLEPDGTPGTAAILLTRWPGGETRLLGRGDYHGRFAEWVL